MVDVKKSTFTGFDLKMARKEILGLSQIEFAEELDIARTSVIKAERTTPNPWMEAACIGLGAIRVQRDWSSTISGPRFVHLREHFGFSPSMLGEEWGVSERTIRAWENGTPPAWTLPALVGLSVMKALKPR
jgi:DNA-binding XRE family transcriptional regulator